MDLEKVKLKDLPALPFMQTIWKSRPDLQDVFIYPNESGVGQAEFIEWFVNHAQKEYNFDDSVLVGIYNELKKENKFVNKNLSNNKFKKSLKNEKKQIMKKGTYKQGVNLLAFIKGDFGIGEGGRRTAASLSEANVDFNIIDLYKDYVYHKNTNKTWENKVTNTFEYDINLFHCNVDEIDGKDVKKSILANRYNIGYWVWELPEFPEKWVKYFSYFNEIWTPSSFAAESISKKAFCPVITVPHSIEVETDKKIEREYFNLPKDKFLFLFMYDVLSWIERKNPQAVIEAFKEAFKDNENVGLVIKVSNSKYGEEDIKKLEELRKGYNNIYVIDEILPKIEVNSLLNSCDVFVSLHRSEGFGLGLAEAMYLGKPVIGTGWSGNMDFMNINNSCPVKYKLIPVEVNYAKVESTNQFWADADIKDAAHYMYKLYNDKAYYDEIANNGRKTIMDDFSAKRVGKIIENRIKCIRN